MYAYEAGRWQMMKRRRKPGKISSEVRARVEDASWPWEETPWLPVAVEPAPVAPLDPAPGAPRSVWYSAAMQRYEWDLRQAEQVKAAFAAGLRIVLDPDAPTEEHPVVEAESLPPPLSSPVFPDPSVFLDHLLPGEQTQDTGV